MSEEQAPYRLSPPDIAARLLGDPRIPVDPGNPRHKGPIGPDQVRQMIIEAVSFDRAQGSPDVETIVGGLMAQFPASASWSHEGVRVMLETALTHFQAQGGRL